MLKRRLIFTSIFHDIRKTYCGEQATKMLAYYEKLSGRFLLRGAKTVPLNLFDAPFKSSFITAYLSHARYSQQKQLRNPSINFLAYAILMYI